MGNEVMAAAAAGGGKKSVSMHVAGRALWYGS